MRRAMHRHLARPARAASSGRKNRQAGCRAAGETGMAGKRSSRVLSNKAEGRQAAKIPRALQRARKRAYLSQAVDKLETWENVPGRVRCGKNFERAADLPIDRPEMSLSSRFFSVFCCIFTHCGKPLTCLSSVLFAPADAFQKDSPQISHLPAFSGSSQQRYPQNLWISFCPVERMNIL